MKFRTLIKKRRMEKGYTIKHLSKKVNISETYLSRLENGERFNPSISVVLDLCKNLDIDYVTMLKTYGHNIESTINNTNITFFSEVNPELFTIDNAIKVLEKIKTFSKQYFICENFVILIEENCLRIIPLLQEGFSKMGYETTHICRGTVFGGHTHTLSEILDIFEKNGTFPQKILNKFR